MRFSKNIKNHYSEHKTFIPDDEIEKMLSNQNQIIEKVISLENFINQPKQLTTVNQTVSNSNLIKLNQTKDMNGTFSRLFLKTSKVFKRFTRFVDVYSQPEE